MDIYLIDRKTQQIKEIYRDVVYWDINFIEYLSQGLTTKIYCDLNTEYFTDVFEENGGVD